MARYIMGRFLAMIPVLIGVAVAVFLMMELTPGDPAAAVLGVQATPAELARVRHAMGLDKPLWWQFVHWLGGILHGDFGISYISHQPVLGLIWHALPVTVELTVVALIFGVALGVPTGVVAAIKRYTRVDYLVTSAALFGISMPQFWFGILLILFFSLRLRWLPASGYVPLSAGLWPNLSSMLMPGLSVGLFTAGVLSRFVRSSMLDVLNQDYVRTARAKGLHERRVIYRHALRNALVPALTVLGIQVAFLLGGAVIIEQVFALPGIGRLVLNAINTRDYPIVQGVSLLVAFIFVAINLVVDIAYTFVNPKIRFEG